MLNNKLNAHGGFTPAAVAPPNAITPEQVLRRHHSQRRGGMGDRHGPLRHRSSALYFIA